MRHREEVVAAEVVAVAAGLRMRLVAEADISAVVECVSAVAAVARVSAARPVSAAHHASLADRRFRGLRGDPVSAASVHLRCAATLPAGGPTRSANVRSTSVQNVLNSRAVAGALHSRAALRNPNTRAQIAATAATAGWHDGRGRGGWWRHRNGGYGWVGPLFWPFAYYDIYNYTLWGSGYDDPFWDYGYSDIYAGIFSPYGYNDLSSYRSQGGSGQVSAGQTLRSQTATPDQLAQMCGDDSHDIAGLPIDQIQEAI